MIAPTVEKLQQQHPGITFAKLDTSEEAGGLDKLAASLSVQSLPAFHFYLHGEEVVPQVLGYKKRPLEEAVAKLTEMSERASE